MELKVGDVVTLKYITTSNKLDRSVPVIITNELITEVGSRSSGGQFIGFGVTLVNLDDITHIRKEELPVVKNLKVVL